MNDINLIAGKVKEVKEEMKLLGLWSAVTPAWVMHYGKRNITTGEDFSEWLQFIYLPNRKMNTAWSDIGKERDYIAPQATKFFSDDVKKGRLLQLLIELDSLS